MAQLENVVNCTVIWDTNKDTEKIVIFDRSISGKYLTLDRADILWNYNNLRGVARGNNYVSTDDGTGMSKLTLNDGYYTFKEIAKKLKERDITVTYNRNTLYSKVETKLKLWKLGTLLGFKEGTEIPANSSKISEDIININDKMLLG